MKHDNNYYEKMYDLRVLLLGERKYGKSTRSVFNLFRSKTQYVNATDRPNTDKNKKFRCAGRE